MTGDTVTVNRTEGVDSPTPAWAVGERLTAGSALVSRTVTTADASLGGLKLDASQVTANVSSFSEASSVSTLTVIVLTRVGLSEICSFRGIAATAGVTAWVDSVTVSPDTAVKSSPAAALCSTVEHVTSNAVAAAGDVGREPHVHRHSAGVLVDGCALHRQQLIAVVVADFQQYQPRRHRIVVPVEHTHMTRV